MIKLAVAAYLISLIATFIGLVISKEFDVIVLICGTYAPAIFAVMWFQYKEKRVPIEAEFKRFYTAYAVLVFGSLFVDVLAMAPSVTSGGLASLLLLGAAYWGFLRFLFNETMLKRHFRKKSA